MLHIPKRVLLCHTSAILKTGDTGGQPLPSSHRARGHLCQMRPAWDSPQHQRVTHWSPGQGFNSSGGSLSRMDVACHVSGQLVPQEVNSGGKGAGCGGSLHREDFRSPSLLWITQQAWKQASAPIFWAQGSSAHSWLLLYCHTKYEAFRRWERAAEPSKRLCYSQDIQEYGSSHP